MQKTCNRNLIDILGDYTFKTSDWEVFDIRIDIPAFSFGSDAINHQTQYSNPLVFLTTGQTSGVGIGFTLGDGNDLLCQSIKKLLSKWNGIKLQHLLEKDGLLYRFLANPDQLRWLSPNSGLVYMAASVILNTLLDWASKKQGFPLWKSLSLEPSENLIKLIDTQNIHPFFNKDYSFDCLERGLVGIEDRIDVIEAKGIPVYYTTWIGESSNDLIMNINQVNKSHGIKNFKIKINADAKLMQDKIGNIKKGINPDIVLFSDSNQSLSFTEACDIVKILDDYSIVWLEEPFAPDNVRLHKTLMEHIKSNKLQLEIVTGENCPNAHTALSFIQENGCDRFQIDACRVMSYCDILPILIACNESKTPVVPHAGGSGLDELVLHITALNHARIRTDEDISNSLTEYIGFCSSLYKHPVKVMDGHAALPTAPGYINNVSSLVYDALKADSNMETTWLKL